MIDGCSDGGWVGRIPVCVFSGAGQQEHNSRPAARDGAVMKERDYISLVLSPAAQEHSPPPSSSTPLAEEKMDCDNVVLSLGLGPPDKLAAGQDQVSALAPEQPPGIMPPHSTQPVDQQLKPKVAPSGPRSQHFWQQDFRVSLSANEHHQHAVIRQPDGSIGHEASSFSKSYTSGVPVWSSMPGRFAIPVPKVSTIPAKRPYQDGTGEVRSTSVQGETVSPGGLPPSNGIYSWNNDPFNASSSGGGAWQSLHVNFEHSVSNHPHGSGVNAAYVHSSRQLGGAMPAPTTTFKMPQGPTGTSMPPVNGPSSVVNGGTSSSSQVVDVSAKPETEHDGIRNKAPVVGWPPVRSFRKNTLQAAHMNSRMGSDDLPTKSMGGPSSTGTMDALDHINGSNAKIAFFVKAKLDGVRICRKVDLSAYNSYDELKAGLQDMFQGFVSDNAKLDLVNGKNYVVTHEDKDGDCLLVGDVPWHMFLESSVKSLRIMKSMDAIGIGEKGSAKLKAEANGKLSQPS